MKVLVYVNPSRDTDGDFTNKVVNTLRQLNKEIEVCAMADTGILDNRDYEYMVVLGGDGTILRAAPYAVQAGAAVMGINLGSVGYLCAYERSEIEIGLRKMINGESKVENRMLLEADGSIVINEAVIYRAMNPRPIKLDVQILNDKEINLRNVKGDGLIIATPTGSTAYSLYAGGKSAEPDSQNVVYTPICAENAEPDIFNMVDEIKITLAGEDSAALSIDGNTPQIFRVGDSLTIKKAKATLKLIKKA